MAIEPTLAQFFGANATQTETQLIITKADLVDDRVPPRFLFTPSATDTAEKLFTGILMKVALGQDTSVDSQLAVASGGLSLVTVSDKLYRQYLFTLRLLISAEDARFPDPDKL